MTSFRKTALAGGLLYLITFIGSIPAAILVGPVLDNPNYVTTRLFEAATITMGVLSLLAVISLRQQGAAAGNAETLVPVGNALVAVRDWAMTLGPNMAAFNALMLGTALYRARLVPRAIPALGIVGAPILISYVIGNILGLTGPGTLFQAIAVFPFFFWELALGLWLTFKGFNESSTLAIEERARDINATASGAAQASISAKAGVA